MDRVLQSIFDIKRVEIDQKGLIMVLRLKKTLPGKVLLAVTILVCQLSVACAPAPLAAEQMLAAPILTLTAEASSSPMVTLPGSASSTPTLPSTATQFPSDTATITITPSPVIPLASVSKETNCRTGPSKHYKFVEKVVVGTKSVVIGRHTPTNYWIIKLRDGRECWLWGEFAIIEGDINSLPEYSPPAVGKIDGEVFQMDCETGERIGGINGADVTIDRPNFESQPTTNEGTFLFEDVPIGEVNISVKHTSYDFDKVRVVVHAGQVSKAEFGTAQCPVDLEITPTPTRLPCLFCQPIPPTEEKKD
jgi:hypothetical protein